MWGCGESKEASIKRSGMVLIDMSNYSKRKEFKNVFDETPKNLLKCIYE